MQINFTVYHLFVPCNANAKKKIGPFPVSLDKKKRSVGRDFFFFFFFVFRVLEWRNEPK